MKTRFKNSHFWERKDKYFFEKLARRHPMKENLKNFMIANFLVGNTWIGDMDEEVYTAWQARLQAMGVTFSNDLSFLEDLDLTFDQLLSPEEGNVSPLVRSYVSGDISLETVVIIDRLTNFIQLTDSDISDQILWPDIRRKIGKYKLLMNPTDNKRYYKLIKKKFTS